MVPSRPKVHQQEMKYYRLLKSRPQFLNPKLHQPKGHYLTLSQATMTVLVIQEPLRMKLLQKSLNPKLHQPKGHYLTLSQATMMVPVIQEPLRMKLLQKSLNPKLHR
jgi:hypothetical protein